MRASFFFLLLLISGLGLFSQPDLTRAAAELIGLSFDEEEIADMQANLDRQKLAYENLRSQSLENAVMPAVMFNPILPGTTYPPLSEQQPIKWDLPTRIKRPSNEAELAFLPIPHLASLIKRKKITSVELTEIYLRRIKQFADSLHCIVTLTEDLALKQARQADLALAEGKYLGPLHGIPYGVKDLLAVPGYPTTWGAMPYKEQHFREQATVVKKLAAAGAVLLGKLSMGALAMGDVWYKERTRNPWNLQQGSSGSSAGSASATAAGLVGFSIGTETLGSIVSPSTRCGVTGLRPSYGRVSRTGAMALSWSMDKIGPICRSAAGAAMVFDAIRGPDGQDMSLFPVAFNYQPRLPLSKLKVGYVPAYFEGRNGRRSSRLNDSLSLVSIRGMGIELIPVSLPEDLPISALRIILTAEAGAAFDELTRSDQDSLLVRQDRGGLAQYFSQQPLYSSH